MEGMDPEAGTPAEGDASAAEKEQVVVPQAPHVHRTPAERSSKGKSARREVSRESHEAWDPPADRRDPVELLVEQGTGRTPELLPIRYGRMLASPFSFYRGAAYVMASDLAGTPRSGLMVQACGDAHVSNFGLFGSPERSWSSTSTTSTSRCPAPGSGTSSV